MLQSTRKEKMIHLQLSVSMLKQFAGHNLTVNPIKPHIIYIHIN